MWQCENVKMECECGVNRAYPAIKYKLLIVNYLTNVLYKSLPCSVVRCNTKYVTLDDENVAMRKCENGV